MSPQKKLITAAAVLVFLGTWGSWKLFQTHRSHPHDSTSRQSGLNSQSTSSNEVAQQQGTAQGTDTHVAVGSVADKPSSSAPQVSASVGASHVANGAQAANQDKGGTAQSPVPAESCLKVSFRHRALATHSSEDECSHHRNLLKLGRADINPSTLCVRVNGTPVRHEFVSGKTDEVVIGPVAGPKDIITAKFCTGKIKCAEKCVYPAKEAVKHDEFLDAIGGTEDDKDTAFAHWDNQDAEKTAEVHQALSEEVKKELEARDQAVKKVADAQNRMEIFKDWISETENGSCGVETAAVRLPAGKQ